MILSNSLKSFVKSSAIFTLASFFVNLLGYAFHVFAGRYLGPASYSEITTVIAYATILSIPVFVLTILIVRRAKYLASLMRQFDKLSANVPLILGSYLTLITLGLLNHLSLVTALIMPAFALSFVLAQLYGVLLQAGKLFSPLSLVITASGVLKLVGALLTPYFPTPLPVLVLLILANLTQIFLSRRFLLAKYSGQDDGVGPALFSLSDPLLKLSFVSVLGMVLLNNMDIVLAKQFLSSTEAGIYGVWSLFAKAITYSFVPLSAVALVFFSDQKETHDPKHILYPSAVFLVFGGVLSYLAFKYLASFLVTALMGAEFSALIPLLPLAAIFGTLYSLIALVNNYFLANSSPLALVPAGIAAIMTLLVIIYGHDLSGFISVMSYGALSLLLLYPTTILLRTKRASSRQ